MSLDGSIEGLREDVPDALLETEVGESSADMRLMIVGFASSEGRRDMVVAVQDEIRGMW